jgi:hypothetical protein
LWLVLSLW